MDLIDAYYMVARDCQEKAETLARTADMLGAMADRMSEARMREKQPPAQPSEEG